MKTTEAKDQALYLVQHFSYELLIKDHQKAKNCSIYLCHTCIKETLDVARIKHFKEVINEIEKL